MKRLTWQAVSKYLRHKRGICSWVRNSIESEYKEFITLRLDQMNRSIHWAIVDHGINNFIAPTFYHVFGMPGIMFNGIVDKRNESGIDCIEFELETIEQVEEVYKLVYNKDTRYEDLVAFVENNKLKSYLTGEGDA